jgi:hypothetical protein
VSVRLELTAEERHDRATHAGDQVDKLRINVITALVIVGVIAGLAYFGYAAVAYTMNLLGVWW